IAIAQANPHEEWRAEKEGKPSPRGSGVTVMPFMMEPGEEIIVAKRLYEVLSNAV
ncbi:unnamed protein product, partial [marine sediment metagenome]